MIRNTCEIQMPQQARSRLQGPGRQKDNSSHFYIIHHQKLIRIEDDLISSVGEATSIDYHCLPRHYIFALAHADTHTWRIDLTVITCTTSQVHGCSFVVLCKVHAKTPSVRHIHRSICADDITLSYAYPASPIDWLVFSREPSGCILVML